MLTKLMMCEYLVHYVYVVCSARIALSLMEFNIILVLCCAQGLPYQGRPWTTKIVAGRRRRFTLNELSVKD